MGTAPEGFENKEIPFIIVIDKQGKFIQLEDTREQERKKKIGRKFLIPKDQHTTGKNAYKVSNILWDHYGYVLAFPKEVEGISKKTPEEIEAEKKKNYILANNQHISFIAKVDELKQALPDDTGISAVAAFLASSEEKHKVMQSKNWAECSKIKGCNLSFRLAEETAALVCQSQVVQDYLRQTNQDNSDNAPKGICLVTGKPASIARLHNAITRSHLRVAVC
ncbi:CRISPR-associated Csd1 family protein [Aggregatibacter actinomycetemcomitans serotype e str. SC1083]|uniref:CRISPR-associated Csd1 family protein n=1 Tax=Aggregatibacter actinomycetemcomitans serotype e str. SC1083 TaxID=907488 RepID=G4A8A3_AGGAC|nr:type I-C CRISPR-associated protein Cas8c/Csd1 [Aggregatibacter actinomycetemcomitans]EGY34069.1 CRISPR-associated Csd1 family protein [Aggregatibacter actinomycetemcomitans serotype e str. SC1083]